MRSNGHHMDRHEHCRADEVFVNAYEDMDAISSVTDQQRQFGLSRIPSAMADVMVAVAANFVAWGSAHPFCAGGGQRTRP